MTNHIVNKLAISIRNNAAAVIPRDLDPPTVLLHNPSLSRSYCSI